MSLEDPAIGAEGVGEDDLAAGFDVGPGHAFHAIRMGQIPSFGAVAHGKTQGLQLGPPGAVGEHRAAGQKLLAVKCPWSADP